MLLQIEQYLKRWPIVLLASFILMSVVYFPLLFQGKVLYGDPIFFQIPIFNFYKEAISNGDSILWNPYNAGGFPIFASLAGFFFPLHYLALLVFSPLTAFNLLIFLASALALFFAIQFLRAINVGVLPSLLGGLSYVIGEVIWLPHVTSVAYAIPFLPLLFWISWALCRRPKKLGMALLGGLSIGLAWLSVMPHFVLWILTAAFAFVIFLAFREKNKKLIIWFLVMNLIGIAVGIWQIAPTFSVAQLSPRAAEMPYVQLAEDPIRPRDFARFFFPDFYSYLPVYRGSDNVIQGSEASLYFGIIPFLFFIFSFGLQNYLAKFFRWFFFICIAVSVQYSPIFYLITKIPVLNSFRVPSRYMIIGSFAAAVLVALAAQAFWEKQKLRVFNRKFFNIAAVLAASLIIIISGYFFARWIDVTSGISFMDFINKVLLPIAVKPLILIMLLLIGWLSINRFLKSGKSLPLVVLIIATFTDFIFAFYFSTTIWPGVFPKQQPADIEFFKNNPGRILSFLPGDYYKYSVDLKLVPNTPAAQHFYQHATLNPNLNLLYGFETMDYYEKLLNRDAIRLLALVGARGFETFGVESLDSAAGTLKEKINLLGKRKPLLNFFGIRWLISGYDLSSLGFQETIKSIFYNPTARPPAYFVDKIDGFGIDSDEIFQKYYNSGFDSVFVECSDCVKTDFSAVGKIAAVDSKNNYLQLLTESPEEQFLVFSQNYYKGWRALIDEKETPIYKVNTVYMGIFIPAGQYKVEFKYQYSLFHP